MEILFSFLKIKTPIKNKIDRTERFPKIEHTSERKVWLNAIIYLFNAVKVRKNVFNMFNIKNDNTIHKKEHFFILSHLSLFFLTNYTIKNVKVKGNICLYDLLRKNFLFQRFYFIF